MTEGQYEEYRKKKEELNQIKEFLYWCGIKYKSDYVSKYKARLIGRKAVIKIGRKGIGAIKGMEVDLPKELQDKIIGVIEDYVDEKETELSEI